MFFWLCCYFRSMFVPRNSSFKSLLYIFWKFDIIIDRQSNNWNVKFGIIYCTVICYCTVYTLYVALVACDVTSYRTGLVFGTALNALNISLITQFLDHGKSSSISHIINGKSGDLQKLLKYFIGTTTSAFNLLALSGVLPITVVLYLKDLLVVVLVLFTLFPSPYLHFHHYLFHLYNNSTNLLMPWNNCHYTLTNYASA